MNIFHYSIVFETWKKKFGAKIFQLTEFKGKKGQHTSLKASFKACHTFQQQEQ